MSSKNKYKYQDVEMTHKVEFLDDMKQLIFDPKRYPEDLNLFTTNSDWRLVGFEEQEMDELPAVPSNACIRKKGMSGNDLDAVWGAVELEGRLNAKLNETAYTPMHFNLRRRGLFLYSAAEPDRQDKETLAIQFSETTFNFQSENDESFSLKFNEKVLKIKKENESREAIKAIERWLFLCAFRGAYCLRNEVPSCYVEDYVVKEIDTVRGADFVHEASVKEIAGSRYYREAIGGFFYLLHKESFKRKTLSGEITLPKWLKPNFRSIPACELNLITNVVPSKVPLMHLKIRLHESEIPLLNENLKYIFPFYKNYLKRTLIVYESNLQDDHVNYMMNQISYPMHTIALPKNQLSLMGLEAVINAASTLYHEVIDCSYNTKLISISGSKIFAWTNANPSVKKLTLKGCYVLLGEEDEFFQGLSNNMCLQVFEIDYMDSYNEGMIRHLVNYDAEIY